MDIREIEKRHSVHIAEIKPGGPLFVANSECEYIGKIKTESRKDGERPSYLAITQLPFGGVETTKWFSKEEAVKDIINTNIIANAAVAMSKIK